MKEKSGNAEWEKLGRRRQKIVPFEGGSWERENIPEPKGEPMTGYRVASLRSSRKLSDQERTDLVLEVLKKDAQPLFGTEVALRTKITGAEAWVYRTLKALVQSGQAVRTGNKYTVAL